MEFIKIYTVKESPEWFQLNIWLLFLFINHHCMWVAVGISVSVLCPHFWFFTVPTAVQSLSESLLKYYQQITRAILGDDPHLMKVADEHKLKFCVAQQCVTFYVFVSFRWLCWISSQTPRLLSFCHTLFMSSVGYIFFSVILFQPNIKSNQIEFLLLDLKCAKTKN